MTTYQIVEETGTDCDYTLKENLTLQEAERWLAYYLNYGHDAYMQEVES